ncbi:MAG: hypothetical protein ACOYI4_01590 [Christensenellales bacterium]
MPIETVFFGGLFQLTLIAICAKIDKLVKEIPGAILVNPKYCADVESFNNQQGEVA